MVTVRRAFISLADPAGIIPVARELIGLGWEIIATRETVALLAHQSIPCAGIDVFVGHDYGYDFPATLHPKIEAALTTDVPYRIDLVFDIPYGPERGLDVGGHTLLALAIKGNRIPVSSYEDMNVVIGALRESTDGLSLPDTVRRQLFETVHRKIIQFHVSQLPGSELFSGQPVLNLKNGENPYQQPASLLAGNTTDALSIHRLNRVSGEEPCFTNLADLDCILQTLCQAAETFTLQYDKVPFIAITAKHGNPCGLAIDWDDPASAITKALFGNPAAVWGGECITNFKIDANLAALMHHHEKRKQQCGNEHWMLDMAAAPEFTTEAITTLGARPSRKLFTNPALYHPRAAAGWSYRHIRGGYLRQPAADYRPRFSIDSELPPDLIDNLIIAWTVVSTSFHGGNEVAIVSHRQLFAAGGGPSTVAAAQTAVERAKQLGHGLAGSTFAADAFFPFTDAPQVLVDAGCAAGTVPEGGKNHVLVKDFFARQGVTVQFLPPEIRGFCRH